MAETRHTTDLIEVIVADHRAVEGVFSQLEQGAGDPAKRKGMVEHVITELVRHSVAEEQYMYPAARKALPDGDEIADHEIGEHAEAERVMSELSGLEPVDPRFEELLSTLMSDIRHHVQDEENDLLPRLREACGQQELAELGSKVLQAKEWAPTRPHPNAPDTPPANRILDPGAGLVDRMRDAVSGGGR
ncbi:MULTISPECIES: hemerythrin domain-containing protein [Streptomonospora]|uniref:Hemerythrin domain-containing protein n=2 Tax=Streptomonospora TaxID=104204 RepID=A0ABV9SJS5_9ACTN